MGLSKIDKEYIKNYHEVVIKRPLSQYVIAVIIVLIVLNASVYLFLGGAKLVDVAKYSCGFLLGMLAMYIAVHIYKWK